MAPSEPSLQTLVRGGILRGLHGPKGGYDLARERRRITVAEILRTCLAEAENRAEPSPALVEHVVAPLVAQIGDGVPDAFETVTVEDLCDRAQAQITVEGSLQPADFTI